MKEQNGMNKKKGKKMSPCDAGAWMDAKSLEIVKVELDMLTPHPLNRKFAMDTPDWDDFMDSVHRRGVEAPLLVRDMGDGTFQILAGHRRAKAAVLVGMEFVPCLIRTMSDGEALELLLNENLQREDLTPGDEAALVDAMAEEFSLTPEEIAKRVSRSVQWVRVRQMLMDLPLEVTRRVNLPKGDDEHVTLGAIEAILDVPEELRKEAVQMVLFPELQVYALNERQARENLKELLVGPWRAEQAWNANKEGFVKIWKKQLREEAGKEAVAGLLVVAVDWKDRISVVRTGVDPMWEIPAAEKYPEAPEKLTWLDLASRHGIAVKVVPSGEETAVMVDAPLLRQAEASREEHGEVPWLRSTVKGNVDEEAKSKVEGIVELLEGGSEPGYQADGEEAERVIDQRMSHHAMIDMGKVKALAMWSVSSGADPMNAPDFVPKWARELAVEGLWTGIDEVCNWVMGLKN